MSEMTQTVTGATQPQSDDASRITARDLRSVFWRSFTLQGSWNYECGEVIVYAWMDRRHENSEKPYGTRLVAGQAVSARLVGK